MQFYTSKACLDKGLVADRFIWEMLGNWTPVDKLSIYKIFLRDFQWKRTSQFKQPHQP